MRYDSYKDSGVEWLGEVPSHWEIKKLKQLFTEKKHTQNLSLSCGAISFGKVIKKPDEKITEATKRSYQEVLKGEFLINPLNLNYDLISLRIALSEIDVVVSAGYIVLKVKNKLNKNYFAYLLHRYDVAYMKLLGSGVRQTINYNHIANSFLVLPPLSEQTAIAQYLDDKTAKIDRAIALEQQQIELLKERKQIVIQTVVTRGLNPDVAFKDSGVEWLGEVPEHWEVKKLKYVLELSNKKEESQNSDKRYIGMENVESFTGKINEIILTAEGISNSFFENEILFGKLRPYLAKSYLAEFDGICSTEFLVYKANKEIYNRFALNIFLSYGFIDTVNSSTYGSKMPRANSEFIANMLLAIPPLSEQTAIAQYLDEQTAKIDHAISIKLAQIDKLKEYKTVLINEVVTGKRRVVQN